MTYVQMNYWTDYLKQITPGVSVPVVLEKIVKSPEYVTLTTDGKITLAILILGYTSWPKL